jgi:hypothetical protein
MEYYQENKAIGAFLERKGETFMDTAHYRDR